jgi:branched-chain amino acid transport system ATP-binding protein
MLEISGLSAGYGGVPAVTDVTLAVPVGSVVTVIGPNGAGKTTLLSAIMGVLPARGIARFMGADLLAMPLEARVEAGVGLVPERRKLFAAMTVDDNLRLGAFRFRADSAGVRRSLDQCLAIFPALATLRQRVAGTLSGGERQMLAMARALMGRPRLLMLDEPSLGLAPLVVRNVLHVITELRHAGLAILLIEQNARAALQIADYGYVLEMGAVRLHGPSAALASDPRVIATYLGGSPDEERTGGGSGANRN